MTPSLEAYLAREREMMELDDRDDPRADEVRDELDALFAELTETERETLNARSR